MLFYAPINKQADAENRNINLGSSRTLNAKINRTYEANALHHLHYKYSLFTNFCRQCSWWILHRIPGRALTATGLFIKVVEIITSQSSALVSILPFRRFSPQVFTTAKPWRQSEEAKLPEESLLRWDVQCTSRKNAATLHIRILHTWASLSICLLKM